MLYRLVGIAADEARPTETRYAPKRHHRKDGMALLSSLGKMPREERPETKRCGIRFLPVFAAPHQFARRHAGNPARRMQIEVASVCYGQLRLFFMVSALPLLAMSYLSQTIVEPE